MQEAIEESINADTICSYLTMFDLSVLSACVSMHLQGAKYATPGTIYATLGKHSEPKPKMKELLIKSINKLMSVIINIDATDAYKKLTRLKKKVENNTIKDYSGRIIRGALLPAISTTEVINGQIVDGAIIFQGLSALYIYAMAKNEIVTIPRHMLEIPDSVSTPRFTEIKTYLSARIQIIKRTREYNKEFAPHIVLETIYRNCRLQEEIKNSRMLRKRVNEHILTCINHLVDDGTIMGYQFLVENPKDHSKNKIVKDIKDCTKIRILYDGVEPLP